MSHSGRTASNQRNADAMFREQQVIKKIERERTEAAEKIAHLRALRLTKEENDRRRAKQA